jgi:hypothetical protein
MLLNEDGLDKKWEHGVKSQFEGVTGWHELGDVETYAPLIFRRVNSGIHENVRQMDSSRVGANANVIAFTDNDSVVDENSTNINNVRSLKSHKVMNVTNTKFRKALVISFHKRWTNNNVKSHLEQGKYTADYDNRRILFIYSFFKICAN